MGDAGRGRGRRGCRGPGHQVPGRSDGWWQLPPSAPRCWGIPGGCAPLEGPGSTALPPWKRLGSTNPWQHTPPHGNPPLMATRTPPPAPARGCSHWGGGTLRWGTTMCGATAGCTECSRRDGGTWVAKGALSIMARTRAQALAPAGHRPWGLGMEPSLGRRHAEGAWLDFADRSRRQCLQWGWPGSWPAGWLCFWEDMGGLKLSRRTGA